LPWRGTQTFFIIRLNLTQCLAIHFTSNLLAFPVAFHVVSFAFAAFSAVAFHPIAWLPVA
jgi:hypothetical protein